MALPELATLDAVGQADLVRRGELTPAELVEAAIDRIERIDPGLNAVIVPLFEHARAAVPVPGPFAGVPFLLKDAGACLAGLPLYSGSRLLRDLDWRAPADTVLGARFRDAGLVVCGKTNLPEFGSQPTTQPVAFGPTRNPWDTSRSVGGSSGGAAAAVAAGLVPVAHASDIGGSIRLPAAWCGTVGLKPSRGRISTAPIVDPNLVEGVISRTVRDTAAVLDAVQGAEADDVYALPPPERPYAAELGRDPEPLRIGVVTEVEAEGLTVDARCAAGALEAAALLESLGHDVEDAGPADLFDDAFVQHTFVTVAREFARMLDGLAASVGRPLGAADMEPFSWALGAAGAAISDAEYGASQTWERAYTARVSAWWSDDFDLLLTPAAGEPPAPLEELVPPDGDPLAVLPRFRRIWCFGAPFSITGQPAISLPIASSGDGLPTGVQLVAALGREDLLIRLAGQLERAAPWEHRLPPLTSAAPTA